MINNEVSMIYLFIISIFLVLKVPLRNEKFMWIRVDHYRYQFDVDGKNWWKRRKLREFIKPVNLKMLYQYGV